MLLLGALAYWIKLPKLVAPALQHLAAGIVLSAVAVELVPTITAAPNTPDMIGAITGGFLFGVCFFIAIGNFCHHDDDDDDDDDGGGGDDGGRGGDGGGHGHGQRHRNGSGNPDEDDESLLGQHDYEDGAVAIGRRAKDASPFPDAPMTPVRTANPLLNPPVFRSDRGSLPPIPTLSP